jgi:hypothetical protein
MKMMMTTRKAPLFALFASCLALFYDGSQAFIITSTNPVRMGRRDVTSTTSTSMTMTATSKNAASIRGTTHTHNQHQQQYESLSQKNTSSSSSSGTSISTSISTTIDTETKSLIQSLLEKIDSVGSDGTKLEEHERQSILDIVQELEDSSTTVTTATTTIQASKDGDDAGASSSDEQLVLGMARIPLTGEHKLIYSDTPFSPQYIGPFKTCTTQAFVDERNLLNIQQLGPLKIEFQAEREIMDDKRIKLFFRRYNISLFGVDVSKQDIDAKGVWKMVFVGEVEMEGRRFFLRVMRTPNLYILLKELS